MTTFVLLMYEITEESEVKRSVAFLLELSNSCRVGILIKIMKNTGQNNHHRSGGVGLRLLMSNKERAGDRREPSGTSLLISLN